MMSLASLSKVGYTQYLNTCVLASYAVACHPFTAMPILDYFLAYCQHFNLCSKHPERSYDEHFHQYYLSKGISGYQVIEELHRNGFQEPFSRARAKTKLDFIQEVGHQSEPTELRLRSTQLSLLMVFVNKSAVATLPSSHSITVGFDSSAFYYFDTRTSQITGGIPRLSYFGELGNGFLVTDA